MYFKTGYTKPCSHSLAPNNIHPHPPTYSHQLLSTTTHFDPIEANSSSFSVHCYSLPLSFCPLVFSLKPLLPMYCLFYSFPVNIQILSPNPTHHLLFQPIFRACFLRAYVPYVLRLTYLCACMFSRFTCPCASVIHFYAF